MKHVVVFLAKGFEEIEALTVVDILRRAKMDVDIISISEERMIEGAHGIYVLANDMNSIGDPREYDACILPGGLPGATNLAKSRLVRNFVINAYSQKKLCCAICAAPKALYEFGLLKGKKCTAYPGILDECEDIEYTGNRVEKDDNIITANGPGSAADFAFAIMEALDNWSRAAVLRENMLFDYQVTDPGQAGNI